MVGENANNVYKQIRLSARKWTWGNISAGAEGEVLEIRITSLKEFQRYFIKDNGVNCHLHISQLKPPWPMFAQSSFVAIVFVF